MSGLPRGTDGRASRSRTRTSTSRLPATQKHLRGVETSGGKPRGGAAGPLVAPHPVQTVRAAEKLLDELLVRQARDVGGADGHLALPADGDGLVGGGEGLLLRRRSLLLR